MDTHAERYCGRCGRASDDCVDRCAQQHRFDPDRFCVVCGHRLDVQLYPDRVESACKVCRVRAARGTGAP